MLVVAVVVVVEGHLSEIVLFIIYIARDRAGDTKDNTNNLHILNYASSQAAIEAHIMSQVLHNISLKLRAAQGYMEHTRVDPPGGLECCHFVRKQLRAQRYLNLFTVFVFENVSK